MSRRHCSSRAQPVGHGVEGRGQAPTSSLPRGATRTPKSPVATSAAASVSSSSGAVMRRLTNRLIEKRQATAAARPAMTRFRVSALW